jgi:SAM-dependent methyltransferase
LTEQPLYAAPRDVRTLEDCAFYHVTDLPGVGTVGDQWDLRGTIDAYLGGAEFDGRRVLDVGTASGFLTFEMERRGAEVVSFDIADGADWNCVPFASPAFDLERLRRSQSRNSERIRNSYWYAHRAWRSRARVHYGDIDALPEGLGAFDVVVFGMVLPHLRDPFRALASGARLSRDRVVVVQQGLARAEPIMHFMPDPATCADPLSWWFMSEGCVERMMGVLGFVLEEKATSAHLCAIRHRFEDCTTFLFRRQP